ncbi:hypothetical protein EDD70_1567 [Hydrogenoanaerobacterium saccharovorans]|uniref:RIO1 family protein n=1 Tax=Hydrogenoanaerobacterium saccharovorans TaxID=474960 RepID=A0A1H7Z9U9_9FIRM|nr:hypothetical protein [Hydrogenoanaerobacterium saccharovorans]RPF48743.1 hypothetical protein EDD70_1567 [Hydrogenoanaerobacterium saccharovorans]SEM55023.1 hypothetical protein SAMN05216180_0523 [Hydrogenoanaerobacterium saccharovorans]
MRYSISESLLSKRNYVFLINTDNVSYPKAVLKKFSDINGFEAETQAMQALCKHNIAVPTTLLIEEQSIVYEHINGKLLVDYLDMLEHDKHSDEVFFIFDKLCQWLAECYTALESEYGCEMVLGDAHLRNFIYSDKIYGIDFECVKEGKKEEDIADLAVFTLVYSPMCTQQKYKLAAHILECCNRYMQLNAQLIDSEILHHIKTVEQRRGISLPKNISHNLSSVLYLQQEL